VSTTDIKLKPNDVEIAAAIEASNILIEKEKNNYMSSATGAF
jgi:hypothetical protein